MKLDKFHIGDTASGAPGHRNAVSGRAVRIAGIEVNFARTPGRKHYFLCGKHIDVMIAAIECVKALAAVVSAD